MGRKKSIFVRDPEPDELPLQPRERQLPQKSQQIHIWLPAYLYRQAHEVASELSSRRGKRVSLSAVVRLGLRSVVKEHLSG